MYKSSRLAKIPSSNKIPVFLLSLNIWFLSSCLLPTLALTHIASKHGCAPETPPLFAGTSVTAPAISGSILINEVLNNPASTWNCSEPPNTFSPVDDSWVELLNLQKQPLNLYAAHAEISPDGGANEFTFPSGSVIAPGGFLVIFPLIRNTESSALSSTWNVILTIGGVIIDQASIPALQADQSFARVPDGGSTWQLVGQPTIGTSNTLPTATSTPTKKPKSTTTRTPHSTGGSTADNSGVNTASTPRAGGTQPVWNQVQLPDSTSATATAYAASQSPNNAIYTPATIPQQNSLDIGHILLLTLLSALLIVALLYCWKLFHAP